jgi:hypothetical protein
VQFQGGGDAAVAAPQAAISSWVASISEDGFLAGRVTAIADNYSRAILATQGTVTARRDGRVVNSAKIGSGGVFQLGNLTHGRYGFVIDGREGVAMFGQFVTDRVKRTGGANVPVQTTLCANEDRDLIRQAMQSMPQTTSGGGKVIPADQVGTLATSGATSLMRASDGTVSGQLAIPYEHELRAANDMDVWFARGGESVTSARSDENGRFSVAGLEPGFYSLIASGSHGFVAIGVQVVDSPIDPVVMLGGAGSQLTQAGVTTVTFSPLSSQDLQGVNIAGAGNNGPGAPLGGAGGPGGGTGGGGGGAGGGMGGGLGLLGAGLGAAALGIALADDDNIISPPGP